jgi:large subunit ribosomal protein L3
MPTLSRPRHGSLQFYPRKRATKLIPRVNWKPISNLSEDQFIPGYLVYKVGMTSAIVKDNTEHSLTKGKRLTIPVTILEAPNMKVFSVRFLKNSKIKKEIVVTNDKTLMSKVKVPKTPKSLDKIPSDYDNVSIIVHSIPSQTSIKKKPDMIELALPGDTKEDKLEKAKSLIGKEISISDFINEKTILLDSRGLTKGKGIQGPVKRFGIELKSHKSEKGRRKPGSIGPWHPARVTFRVPMSGQLGLFTRINYNNIIITYGSDKEKSINPKSGFKKYGNIKSNYIILKGSIQGPSKRQILLTKSFRPSKSQSKKQYEYISLEK